MDKLIHRIWISPDGSFGMPEEFVTYGERWKELNPEWDVDDWDMYALEQLDLTPGISDVVADLFSRSPLSTSTSSGRAMTETLACQLADVFSYCILRNYGGVYVNCDIDPVRPLSLLPVPEGNCWACWENDEFLVNAAMGGPNYHSFWQALCDELPKRYFAMPHGEMNRVTGPHLLTSVYKSNPDGFTPLPRVTFNPFLWNDIPMLGRLEDYDKNTLPPETVGVHHWAHRRSMRSNIVEEGVEWTEQS